MPFYIIIIDLITEIPTVLLLYDDNDDDVFYVQVSNYFMTRYKL